MASLAQKRRLDTTLGAPICTILNLLARILGAILRRDHSLTKPPRRILVIKLVGLGSAVHSTLLLRALKAKYPEATLGFLCFRELRGLLGRIEDVDEILSLDDSSYWRLLCSVLGFVWGSWRRPFDLVIDLEVHSKFSTILSTLTCARDRAGYYVITTRFRSGLYTHLVYYNRYRHVQEAYRQLGRALGVEAEVGQPLAPRLTQEERDFAEKLLEQWQVGNRHLLLVNVNAGDLCLERRWEPWKFARVMEVFAAREDVVVVMTGSPPEQAYTESVRQLVDEALRDRVVNSAGTMSFGQYLALLARSGALLTNDSGPLHLAASFGVSTVSLWGPGLPATYQPLVGNHRALCRDTYCSPCLYWVDELPCAGDNVCMQRITWQEVAAATAEVLSLTVSLPEPEETTAPKLETKAEGYFVRRSVPPPQSS